MKWQVGDQVWTVESDGQKLRPVRLGVVGRVVPGGGFVDRAGKPPRFIGDYAPFVFKCEEAAARFCSPPAVIRRADPSEEGQRLVLTGDTARRFLAWPRVWSGRVHGARA